MEFGFFGTSLRVVMLSLRLGFVTFVGDWRHRDLLPPVLGDAMYRCYVGQTRRCYWGDVSRGERHPIPLSRSCEHI